MGYNNPPIPWPELEARLSGRPYAAGPGRPKRGLQPDVEPVGYLDEESPVVPYAELHAHSSFSFLDGANTPEELVAEANRLGLHALALTDHGGFGGAPRFAEAAAEHGLTTVHGAELDLGNPDRHLLVLARGVEGYHRLSAAITEANLRGEEKGQPVHDLDELVDLGRDHWLVLTGCRKGWRDAAAVNHLVDLFGPDNVAVELTDSGLPGDSAQNDILASIAAEAGLPTIATGNVHAARPENLRLAHAFAAVRAGRTLEQMQGHLVPGAFLRSGREMAHKFSRYPGAVARTVEFADQLAFDLRLANPGLPILGVPDGHTPMTWLRELVHRGADRLYAHNRQAAEERLQRELAVIEAKDFAGYFLIVHDIVAEARRRGILCQGRGSAANSAVCYALGITAVDSIFYDLPFERFLAATRDEEPDIDVDFDSDRREEIIQWVYETHGRRNAAQVANTITYRSRSAIRDMATALGYSKGQCDAWVRHFESRSVLPDESTIPKPVLELAQAALRAPRHRGIHSGGMVLTKRPIGHVVPIERARMEKRTVVQWDKDDCAYMGLVKFDLLGLGMLGAVQKTFDLISENTGEHWELADIPKEEPAVYDMLCIADSIGVFQVESRAQISSLPRLRPRSFHDLAVQIALIRPGPIQGGAIHPYIRRRTGVEPIDYMHPLLEPVLARTLGIPVFQEQLMQIAMAVGGCTGDDADLLRRAMGSKRGVEKIERLRTKLFDGMAERGITGELAESIYQRIEAFANFGFAESHSLSFALLVYASSWLKLHYPAAFLAGLLRSQPMGFYSPQTLIADARRHGVETLRPDIMFSAVEAELQGEFGPTGMESCVYRTQPPVEEFEPRETLNAELAAHRRDGQHRVRLGLSSVRGVAVADAERIVTARRDSVFTSVADLARRAELSTAQTEALAEAGALDSLGLNRREALWLAGFREQSGALAGTSGATDAPQLPLMDPTEVVRADFAATGVSVDRHPIELIRDRLEVRGVVSAAGAAEVEHERRAWVAGLVTHRQRPNTAGGVTFLNLEDETGLLNVVVFPQIWERHRLVLRTVQALAIYGRVEHGDGAVNFISEAVLPLDRLLPGTGAVLGGGYRSRDFC